MTTQAKMNRALSVSARRAAAEEAGKKKLLEGLSKPSGVADEEHVKRAAAIIGRALV